MVEHAVIANIKLTDDGFGSDDEREKLFSVEEQLEEAISSAGAGEFDGNEFGAGFCTFYMYGPNADKLASVVLPILQELKPQKGSYLTKRFGEVDDENAREEEIQLSV